MRRDQRNANAGFRLHAIALACHQTFEPVARLDPVLLEKRNFREIKARIPKARIERNRLAQGPLRLVELALAHQNHSAEVERFRQIGLARIDLVQGFERLVVALCVERAEGLIVNGFEFRLLTRRGGGR